MATELGKAHSLIGDLFKSNRELEITKVRLEAENARLRTALERVERGTDEPETKNVARKALEKT